MSSNIHSTFYIKSLSCPTNMPITLDEAKLYLRVEHSNDDNLIPNLIRCTYEMAIYYTKLSLLNRILKVSYKKIKRGYLELPYGPVQNVQLVQYINNNHFILELGEDNYIINVGEDRLFIKSDYDNTFIITYQAGFGEKSEDIPSPILQGMLIHLAALYDNRAGETPIPDAAKLLYLSYRKIKA